MSLLDLNNFTVYNQELFYKIKEIYKEIIECTKIDNPDCQKPNFIHEIYFYFRFLMENILLMIENKFIIEKSNS